MRRLAILAVLASLVLSTIGIAAQSQVLAPIYLEAGQVQPIECETALIGTLDAPECREPVAGEVCPASLHEQWKATGPDGQEYPTWHPPIDPTYGCHYQHEHGVDPGYFSPDFHPLYGYTANQHGMAESHAGFKTYVWDNPEGTHRWLVTQHFGTSGLGRACTRYHTFDVAVANLSTNEIEANLHVMGDYGIAISAQTGAILQPVSCPDQGDAYAQTGTSGRRHLQIASDPSGILGYEPWRLAKTPLPLIGLVSGHFTINTTDPMTGCDTPQCNYLVESKPDGAWKGTRRFIQDNVPENGGFRISNPQQTGTFYTDPMGLMLHNEGDPHSVAQYIKPGLNFATHQVHGKCWDLYGDGRPFVCGLSNAPKQPYYSTIIPPN